MDENMNDDEGEKDVENLLQSCFEGRASEQLWRSLYPNFFLRFERRLQSVALLIIIIVE
jgi:hypothetical protein